MWNRTNHRAESLAKELQAQNGITITVHEDVHSCVKDADIIIWAGSATSTVYLTKNLLKPGACIISVGTSPSMPSGISEDIFKNAQLYTESTAAAFSEMGCFIEKNHLNFREIGEVILGRDVGVGALGASGGECDFIVYQSLGSGMMDAAAGEFVLINHSKDITDNQNKR